MRLTRAEHLSVVFSKPTSGHLFIWIHVTCTRGVFPRILISLHTMIDT